MRRSGGRAGEGPVPTAMRPKVAWLTDVHLNFVEPDEVGALARRIRASGADSAMIGGDIAEADTFGASLRRLADESGVPVYFVLGNHDYYKGSIAVVREEAAALTRDHPLLHWLPAAEVVQLSESTTLVGHGGWGDGRIGDFLGSEIVLNDYLLIDEIAGLLRPNPQLPEVYMTRELQERLMALGDEAAEHLRRVLPMALERGERVLVLTHVPPFREACWHEDTISGDNWLPHISCKAVGDVLVDAMRAHPDRSMTVLCGHTHSRGHARILDNLEVITGGAEYHRPEIQSVLELG